MADIFLKTVNMSISAGWIVLALMLLRLLLKKAPKWISCILWGIVGLRLIMPFSLESVFSLIPSAETISKNADSPRPHFESGFTIVDNQINDYLKGNYFEGVTRPMGNFVDVTTILGIAWIIGIIALLAYTVISYLRLKRKVDTAVLLCDNIFQSENVVSPFVLGIIKPRIYLPFNMNESDMNYVIAHEQAHIRRRDHWWKPIGFLLLTVYWFNPLIWVGYILLCRDIELACDEKVVKELDGEERADYSEALLSCSVNRRMIAACPLAFGEVGVKNRVKSVLNYKKPAFWIIIIAIIASIIAAACFLTNPLSEKLKNIENLTLDSITDSTVAVLISDGETYQAIGKVSKNLLKELADIEISRREVSKNRSEDRDTSKTLVLQTENDTKPIIYSYVKGTYIHFNSGFTEVWVNTGVKPTLSYKVKNPENAEKIYNDISSYNESISDIGGSDDPTNVVTTVELETLRTRFPMYFDLSAPKGLEVYIWQMAEGSYSCGLLPGKNRNYTQEELWALHKASATLDEMKAIVLSYSSSGITPDDVVICPIQMPHSSYLYTIDEAYQEKITNLFWSDFPTMELTSYSPIIDTAAFDIDGDGKEERCTLSHGPTSGLFTFTLNVWEIGSPNSKFEYFNIFNGEVGNLSFAETDNGMKLCLETYGEQPKIIYYDFGIKDGNITLTANGEAVAYWGEQGVGSVYSPVQLNENGTVAKVQSYPYYSVMGQIHTAYTRTPTEHMEENYNNGEFVITKTHYMLNDSRWYTEGCTYKYRLEITGRLNNAAKDTTYIVLSNTQNITFEQTWKASGLSSLSTDYFKPEDAVIVGNRNF